MVSWEAKLTTRYVGPKLCVQQEHTCKKCALHDGFNVRNTMSGSQP